MPLYDWTCSACLTVTTVIRPMSESRVAPECGCGPSVMTKLITCPQVSIPSYPSRLPGWEHAKHFSSHADYREHLKIHDLIPLADCRDPSTGKSQHRHNDHLQPSVLKTPPTEKAADLLQQMRSGSAEDGHQTGWLNQSEADKYVGVNPEHPETEIATLEVSDIVNETVLSEAA